jgi:hypothetical protein
VASVDDISRAADQLEPEVPVQERGDFDNAVAHALNLAQETDPAVRERLERLSTQLDPPQRKWYERLTDALEAG